MTESIRYYKRAIEGRREISCFCETCREMCRVPCWPTPDEARRLIRSGHAHDLEITTEMGGIEVLAPRDETTIADQVFGRPGGCVFWDETGKCRLHALGMKPLEGRLAHHSISPRTGPQVRTSLAWLWSQPRGRAVVRLWRKITDEETTA